VTPKERKPRRISVSAFRRHPERAQRRGISSQLLSVSPVIAPIVGVGGVVVGVGSHSERSEESLFAVAVAGARPFGVKGRSSAFLAAALAFSCHPEPIRAKRGWVRDLLLLSLSGIPSHQSSGVPRRHLPWNANLPIGVVSHLCAAVRLALRSHAAKKGSSLRKMTTRKF